ncbi:MAG: proteasome ATPase [Bifidobacterium sp.]|nr:proteasome ATPase [Bifidobacterium sp.]MCH4175735.1 proteasome ATPase [Bifidobacterium sp.]
MEAISVEQSKVVTENQRAGVEHEQAQQLQELRDLLDTSREKNHALAKALTRAGHELGKAKSQLMQQTQPPLTFAVLLSIDSIHTDEQGVNHANAEVLSGSRRMIVPVSSMIDTAHLQRGQLVLLNESLVLVQTRDAPVTGVVRSVQEIIDSQRVIVTDVSGASTVVTCAQGLTSASLKVSDRVILDNSQHVALGMLPSEDNSDLVLEETPDVTFNDIGGLDEQIERIRDAVQLPFQHRALFERYSLRPPKGILLYGPPGNGKTMIAKAVANSLAEGSSAGSGVFLSVKGPELLNKFVGESERIIRGIFKRARERASSGAPVIVFIDEMDSLLRTRGTGVSSDVETTIVPQFLAELDGVESLDNVMVIGASNRVDMIDPAVLRPGRLDVKIRVDRPHAQQADGILRHYLTDDLPLGDMNHADVLVAELVKDIYARNNRRHVCDVSDEQGVWTSIYFGDLVSGAMLRNIVDRAKTQAVKASIEHGVDIALDAPMFAQAIRDEFLETVDSVCDADPTQWARITGLGEGRVVRIVPRQDSVSDVTGEEEHITAENEAL